MSTLTVSPEGTVREVPLAGLTRNLDFAAALFVVVVSSILFATPLRHSANLLPYAQDDLYYYLVIARNLAHGFGSTFDGVTPTNGYHPLYLLLLWAVSKGNASLLSIFRFLWLLDIVAATATFLITRALLNRAFTNKWLTNGFALIVLWMSFYRFYHQMEVTLVLPFGFLLLLLIDRPPAELGAKQWAVIGLICSLLSLSRLDAGLLVALCGLGVLAQREYRLSLTGAKVISFVLGCLPLLVAYLWTNVHFFGRWMPISGAAKQMKSGHGFAWRALRLSLSHGTEIMFVLSLIALCWFVLRFRELRPQERVICAAGLLFPFVHWGVNLTVSDWMMWSWYKYSLTFSMAMLFLLAGKAMSRGALSRVRMLNPAICVLGVLLVVLARYRPDAMMVDIAGGARFIRQFAESHPGRYAMGDRAGMVGYILGQPVIQTEGLMMDSAFLDRVRRREPLLTVLHDYRVDYYIGFKGSELEREPRQGCFAAVEPAQAGARSPVMRAELCDAPVAISRAPSGRTLVFDLRRSHATAGTDRSR